MSKSAALMAPTVLLRDLRRLIEGARNQLARAANASMTLTYWHVGRRIGTGVLRGRRAAYGEQAVATVAEALVREYGRSFSEKNLRRMVQFAQAFPNEQIVEPGSRSSSGRSASPSTGATTTWTCSSITGACGA